MTTDDEGIVGDELLSKTGSGGLFSDGYLAEKPIESYLDSDERPRVVFGTDGSGVVRERPQGQTTYEPASDYRTLVAATSHRVVLVVGGADDGSDHFQKIPLTRIDHVEATSGLRDQSRAEDYEAATEAYQRAREICESALERERLSPESARHVRDVFSSIERDRERLAVSPIRVAAAFDRTAAASTLSGEAAERWHLAYDRYRQVLELDWGADDDRFVGDVDRIRKRLATIAAELLAARSRAAALHRRAAIRLTTVQSPVAAMDAYVDARDHLQAAIETARELDPPAAPSLRERHKAVERRIEVLADGDAETGRQTVRTSGGLPVGDAGAIQPVFAGERAAPVPVRTDWLLPAVGRQPSDETTLAVFEFLDSRRPTLAVAQQDDSRTQYLRRVESLGEQSLRHTVADVWQDLGWTVERTDGGSELLAKRLDVGATLLLSVRRRASAVAPSIVTELAGHTADRDGEPWPILVTTDPIEPESFETAISAGVTIVDAHGLAELCYRSDVQPDSPRPGTSA